MTKKIETLPLSATAILTKLTDQWNDAIFKYNHNVKKIGKCRSDIFDTHPWCVVAVVVVIVVVVVVAL